MRIMLLLLTFLLACGAAYAADYAGQELDPLKDYGYCGPPPRDASGKIIRRDDIKVEFAKIHPCPSTGEHNWRCPGWALDHTRPLACGGCDSVSNLAWLSDSVKSTAAKPGFYPKDRIERKVYGLDPPVPDTKNCTFVTPERALK